MPGRLLQPENVIWSAHGYRKPRIPVLNFSHPINQGLQGIWLLNDTQGTIANDLTLNGNNGTVVNGPLAATQPGASPAMFSGPFGGLTRHFDGPANSYIQCPTSASLNITAAVTICCWQFPVLTYSAARMISNGDAGGSPNNGFGIGNDTNGFTFFEIAKSGTYHYVDGTSQYSGSGTGIPSTWVFSAGTYDGSTGTIWFNGKAEGTFSFSNALGSSAAPLTFGAMPNGVGYNLDGMLDGIRIYNRALSAAEIWQLYVEPYAGVWDASPKRLRGIPTPASAYSYAEIWA